MSRHFSGLQDVSQLISQMATDLLLYSNNSDFPSQLKYNITSSESNKTERKARLAALKSLKPKILHKVAFDTRRVDQENTRNPRENLQHYHRSDPFEDPEVFEKSQIFAKLVPCLENIRNSYGSSQDYLTSYSRVLLEHTTRILRVNDQNKDIFQPQLNYLEQLLYNRYRLTPEIISQSSEEDLINIILSKDDGMVKKGLAPYSEGIQVKTGVVPQDQNSIVNAIFGNTQFRKPGEKAVERTITITIRDNVIE